MAGIIVCLGLFVGALWSPVLDGIDAEFPSRAELLQGRQPTDWTLHLADGGRDSTDVRDALGVLGPGYRDLALRSDARILLTSRDALAQAAGDTNELMYTAGIYVPDKKQAYIAYDAENPGRTALHELGHMVDHLLDYPSQSAEFERIYTKLRGDDRLAGYPRTRPRELFAELFAMYHFSDRQRDHVVDRFPEAARYFAELERSMRER